jgi:hypothetical protein
MSADILQLGWNAEEFMGEYSAYSMAKKLFDSLTGQAKQVDRYEQGIPVFRMNDVTSNIPLPTCDGEALAWAPKVEPPPKVNIQNLNSYVNAINKPFQNMKDIMNKIVPPPLIQAPLLIDFENIKNSLNKIKIQEQQQQALKNISKSFDLSKLTKSLQDIQEKENSHFDPFSHTKIGVFTEQQESSSNIGLILIPIFLLFFFNKMKKNK